VRQCCSFRLANIGLFRHEQEALRQGRLGGAAWAASTDNSNAGMDSFWIYLAEVLAIEIVCAY
jgi:hypothetical protein